MSRRWKIKRAAPIHELPLRQVFSEIEWGVEKGGASEVPEVRVVEAWHDALNSEYVERLVSLSDPGIVGIGPRGRGSGEWVSRVGISLEPLRVFHKAHPDKAHPDAGGTSERPAAGVLHPDEQGGVSSSVLGMQ